MLLLDVCDNIPDQNRPNLRMNLYYIYSSNDSKDVMKLCEFQYVLPNWSIDQKIGGGGGRTHSILSKSRVEPSRFSPLIFKSSLPN